MMLNVMSVLSVLIVGNIFGDTFGKLFRVIWDAIKWIGEQIGRFFSWLGELIWDAIQWLGRLLKNLFDALLDLLLTFFKFIYALVDALLYFLWQIGLLAAKLFMLFLELLRLIWAFIVGFGRTLASLTYAPSSGGGHGYSQTMGKVFAAAEPLQLNVIAYILLFGIWLFTAVQVIKLLSGLRVGGD